MGVVVIVLITVAATTSADLTTRNTVTITTATTALAPFAAHAELVGNQFSSRIQLSREGSECGGGGGRGGARCRPRRNLSHHESCLRAMAANAVVVGARCDRSRIPRRILQTMHGHRKPCTQPEYLAQ